MNLLGRRSRLKFQRHAISKTFFLYFVNFETEEIRATIEIKNQHIRFNFFLSSRMSSKFFFMNLLGRRRRLKFQRHTISKIFFLYFVNFEKEEIRATIGIKNQHTRVKLVLMSKQTIYFCIGYQNKAPFRFSSFNLWSVRHLISGSTQPDW